MGLHKDATGVELHYPKGAEADAGVALDLDDSHASAMHWTNRDGSLDYLVIATSESPRRIYWGESGLGLAMTHKIPKNSSTAAVFEDTDGTDFLVIGTTTGATFLQVGNSSSRLGFHGATPVAQQAGAGITTVAQLVTVLQNLGLLS